MVGEAMAVAERVEPGGPMVASERTPEISAWPSGLAGYRAAVDDLVQEASSHLRRSALAAAEAVITKRLGQREFTGVLSSLDGGVDEVACRLLHEIGHYRPSVRSSAGDLAGFVRIFLLSLIDLMWWSKTAPFVSDADVLSSTELVDLKPLRSAKMLEFQYRAQPAGLPGRALDWAQRQALPAIRPHTAGLRFTRSRPAVVAVVNQIARELAAALPPRTPRLWVNSLVRSVQHQQHLRSLGYTAALPSSHCVGYACDVEMLWFRRFDLDNRLARLLCERQDAGQLNVIDEGQAWHLCVSPLVCDELQAACDAQLLVR
jgi:hypothetical protein